MVLVKLIRRMKMPSVARPANRGPHDNANHAPCPRRRCDSPPRILRALCRALAVGPVTKSRERIPQSDTRAHAHDAANHRVVSAIGTARRLLTRAKGMPSKVH